MLKNYFGRDNLLLCKDTSGLANSRHGGPFSLLKEMEGGGGGTYAPFRSTVRTGGIPAGKSISGYFFSKGEEKADRIPEITFPGKFSPPTFAPESFNLLITQLVVIKEKC